MKTVLFIPGYQEDINSRNYRASLDTISTAGYIVKFVHINWKRTTITDWVEEFNHEYIKYDPDNTIIAGFSFGAMTAITAAASRNPNQLWLFSLSPYFKEDKIRSEWGKILGIRRINEFEKLSFTKLVKKITCPVLIFVGEIEISKYPELDFRFVQATKLLRNVKSVRIPGTDHDVSAEEYTKAIRSSI